MFGGVSECAMPIGYSFLTEELVRWRSLTLPTLGGHRFPCHLRNIAVFVNRLSAFIGHALFKLHGFFTEDALGTPLDFWRFLNAGHLRTPGRDNPTLVFLQLWV
jgi:hypothetical protein